MVEVGLKWEKVVGVEMIECVEVTVKLGEDVGDGGDE